MAELTISAAVGAPPAVNREADVRTVQNLLQRVTPPLAARVSVTGVIDQITLRAIREFQQRFMSNPDGRVDPDGRTLWHLNDGLSPRYLGCNAQRRRVIDRDIINAQKWLDVVIQRLGGPMENDLRRKVRNVFHIDVDDHTQSPRFAQLRQRFRRLRESMDEAFPLQCESSASLFAAYVDLSDATGTMHFPPGHFRQSENERIETVIHERSHTVFNISHAGMSGAGQIDLGQNPDDDNGFTHEQAMANAYCYGWLATSLQPTYTPSDGALIIKARPHR